MVSNLSHSSCTCSAHVDGYYVKFKPIVEYKEIDKYEKQEVKFETGVSIDKHMLKGFAAGAISGAALGAALGSLGGGALGFVIGGIIGSIFGAAIAYKKIKSLPKEKVEITVKEPVYETKEIGKIPENTYFKGSKLDLNKLKEFIEKMEKLPATKAVYEKVPVLDENGKVKYNEYKKVIEDHGKPIVTKKEEVVKMPEFKGYNTVLYPDIHVYKS